MNIIEFANSSIIHVSTTTSNMSDSQLNVTYLILQRIRAKKHKHGRVIFTISKRGTQAKNYTFTIQVPTDEYVRISFADLENLIKFLQGLATVGPRVRLRKPNGGANIALTLDDLQDDGAECYLS